jgi:hypothetical protein
MPSSPMRLEILDHAEVGRKIVQWTIDPATRPKDFADFKNQLASGLRIVDPNITKFELVETPPDKVVIRLPEKDMIERAKTEYTHPSFPPYRFPFPGYLPVNLQRVAGITAEELFYSAVGSYTTAECE